jgi:pimeloyl-ACP methyl ester carboxylesterase
VRGEFIDLSGERLYYYAAGSRGSGEPILLVHGFPTSSHLWLDVVAKLPLGHRVIVVDLLGFGRSDAPLPGEYTVAAHGARLIRLLDALQIERACLAGHEMGGAIASWVALNAPDRVSAIALVGAPVRDSGLWQRGLRGFARRLSLRLPGTAWLWMIRTAIVRTYSDPERGHRSADQYLMPFVSTRGAAVFRRLVDQLDVDEATDLRNRLAEVRVRVAECRGSSWRFLPEESPSEVAATIASVLRQ